jgi:hypothetical protein
VQNMGSCEQLPCWAMQHTSLICWNLQSVSDVTMPDQDQNLIWVSEQLQQVFLRYLCRETPSCHSSTSMCELV